MLYFVALCHIGGRSTGEVEVRTCGIEAPLHRLLEVNIPNDKYSPAPHQSCGDAHQDSVVIKSCPLASTKHLGRQLPPGRPSDTKKAATAFAVMASALTRDGGTAGVRRLVADR